MLKNKIFLSLLMKILDKTIDEENINDISLLYDIFEKRRIKNSNLFNHF